MNDVHAECDNDNVMVDSNFLQKSARRFVKVKKENRDQKRSSQEIEKGNEELRKQLEAGLDQQQRVSREKINSVEIINMKSITMLRKVI